MKKTWYTALATAGVALMLSASTVLAGEADKTDKSKTSGADQSSSQPAASPATGGAASASADFTGRHTMEGEVTRINQQKGMVSVKTAEGTLDLHFPPSAISTLKKGDRVAVEMALKPEGGAASPATGKSRSRTSSSSESPGGSQSPSSSPSTGTTGGGTKY